LAIRVLLAQPAAWGTLAEGGGVTSAEIERMLGDRWLWWLLHPPRVAIVGPANAGKSTLANHLFARERSITADLPGTTRDWVGEIANLDGLAVMLVDTPGQRTTKDLIEAEAMVRADQQIQRADLVVLVLDAALPLEPDQVALVARYPRAIRVVNKTDLSPAWDFGSLPAIQMVATSGEGVDALRRAIRHHFNCGEDSSPDRPRWWTERQRVLLECGRYDPSVLRDA
jgi:tRNA modification GTPase